MYRLISYSFCILVAALVLFAFSPRDGNEEDSENFNVRRVQFNDLVAVGDKLVAVGERGAIVVSENSGQAWKLTHDDRSEEHTSELQSRPHLVCRLLHEKKKDVRSVCEVRGY